MTYRKFLLFTSSKTGLLIHNLEQRQISLKAMGPAHAMKRVRHMSISSRMPGCSSASEKVTQGASTFEMRGTKSFSAGGLTISRMHSNSVHGKING